MSDAIVKTRQKLRPLLEMSFEPQEVTAQLDAILAPFAEAVECVEMMSRVGEVRAIKQSDDGWIAAVGGFPTYRYGSTLHAALRVADEAKRAAETEKEKSDE